LRKAITATIDPTIVKAEYAVQRRSNEVYGLSLLESRVDFIRLGKVKISKITHSGRE
jgi:hypothetical protein